MKKIFSMITVIILCMTSLTNGSVASAINNTESAVEISHIQNLLDNNCVSSSNIELVASNIYEGESIPYTTSVSVGTRAHEKVYRYIDVKKSENSASRAPVYSYINDYTVEVYLFDKDTKEEWARGFVSANFRYNSEYQEAKCLSTNAGEISSLDGYTVETTHRVDNVTWDVGGAYGEVNFEWGILDIFKNRNTVKITCNSDGDVEYIHTKLES